LVFYSEGRFIPISTGDKDFLASLIMKDVYAHIEELLSYIKTHGNPTPSISSLAMNLNYTTVPVSIAVVPVVDLLHQDSGWDALIQQALESGGKQIFTKTEIQRGGIEATVGNLIPAPMCWHAQTEAVAS
jgi:hypothetical protein